MDTKEKSAPLRETTDADYIMFNHNVLSAYRDLLELKNLGLFSWILASMPVVSKIK